MRKLYQGPLDLRKMSSLEKRAYQVWNNQRSKCDNPKHISYPYYGAKGIKVEYSSREFIPWYLKEYEKKDVWKRPTVARFDHDKNYTFENIELIENTDNIKERNKRRGNPGSNHKRAVAYYNVYTGKIWKKFDSIAVASEETRICGPDIIKYCQGKYFKTRDGFAFRYVDERKE